MQDPIYIDGISDADAAAERIGERVSVEEPYIHLEYNPDLTEVERARLDMKVQRAAGPRYRMVELDGGDRSLELQKRRLHRMWDNVVKG